MIVTGGDDKSLHIYDKKPFKYNQTLQNVSTGFINRLVFNADGSKMYGVTSDKFIMQLDMGSFEV